MCSHDIEQSQSQRIAQDNTNDSQRRAAEVDATEIRVPQLPESVADATLVTWHKQPGDPIRRDENLADLETDKVVLEVPAPANGVVSEIRVPSGAVVTSGQVLAVIEEGSLGRAARHLKISQPALTKSIHRLEDQLGVPVWDRATKVARLTPQGKAVLGAARRVLGHREVMRFEPLHAQGKIGERCGEEGEVGDGPAPSYLNAAAMLGDRDNAGALARIKIGQLGLGLPRRSLVCSSRLDRVA